jgi:hypothetical protein
MANKRSRRRGAVEARKNGMEYRRGADGKSWVLGRFERRLVLEVSPGAEHSLELTEIEELLRLVPGLHRYEVAVGPLLAPDPARYPGPLLMSCDLCHVPLPRFSSIWLTVSRSHPTTYAPASCGSQWMPRAKLLMR